MNVRYRIESSEAEREPTTTSSGASMPPQAQASREIAGRDAGSSGTRRLPAGGGWRLHRVSDEAVLRGRDPGAGVSEEPRPGRSVNSPARKKLVRQPACASSAGPRPLDAGSVAARRSGSPSIRACRTRRFRRLAENDISKPWRKDMWRIPQVNGEDERARMEDVLDLYAKAGIGAAGSRVLR